jgi:hypothetical protein
MHYFIDARNKIYDAMIAIQKKYGYQFSSDVLEIRDDIFVLGEI